VIVFPELHVEKLSVAVISWPEYDGVPKEQVEVMEVLVPDGAVKPEGTAKVTTPSKKLEVSV